MSTRLTILVNIVLFVGGRTCNYRGGLLGIRLKLLIDDLRDVVAQWAVPGRQCLTM